MRCIDRVQGAFQQQLFQARLLGQQAFKVFSVIAERDVGCRFRRIRARCLERPPQKVRWEQQANDLLSTVGQGFGELDDPR
jgi:hypothetical protein